MTNNTRKTPSPTSTTTTTATISAVGASAAQQQQQQKQKQQYQQPASANTLRAQQYCETLTDNGELKIENRDASRSRATRDFLSTN